MTYLCFRPYVKDTKHMKMKITSEKMSARVTLGLLLISATVAHAALIGFEAESGAATVTSTIHDGFQPILSDPLASGGQYITTENRVPAPAPGAFPSDLRYTATYNVLFSEAGDYDLYARLQVEVGNADDSFFYGRIFDTPDPTSDTDNAWININDLVTKGPVGEYIWVNLSEHTGVASDAGTVFTGVTAGPQEFWIGGREDGLRIDAFAFGTADQTFTNDQLDASLVPEPSIFGMLLLSSMGALTMRRRRV